MEARIEKLAHEGRGITHIDGKTSFVFGALAGERVRVRYTRRRRRYDEGEVVEVLEAANDRRRPPCRHFGRCGGCSLQHMTGEAQIRHKQAVMLEQLAHLAGPPEAMLAPLRCAETGYRHRARLSVRYVEKKGRVVLGFRERNGRFVADLDSCEVLVPGVARQLPALRGLLDALDARQHIPQLEVAAGEEAAVLVLRHLVPLGEPDRARLRDFERVSGLRFYLQGAGPESMTPLSEAVDLHYHVADGRGRPLKIVFGPTDFTQINFAGNRALILRVLSLLDSAPGGTVLDLYCGLGNFSLPLARQSAGIIGVEREPALLRRAAGNAQSNGIDNLVLKAADLSDPAQVARLDHCQFDRVLLDPPRTGALTVARRLRLEGVHKVVYVSCNPATLARDAAVLVRERGWRLRQAGVVDLFPQTAHVESIAVFEP